MPQSVRNPEGRRLLVDHLTVRAISNVHEQRTLLISANDYRMGTATRVNSPLEEASHVSLYNQPCGHSHVTPQEWYENTLT